MRAAVLVAVCVTVSSVTIGHAQTNPQSLVLKIQRINEASADRTTVTLASGTTIDVPSDDIDAGAAAKPAEPSRSALGTVPPAPAASDTAEVPRVCQRAISVS